MSGTPDDDFPFKEFSIINIGHDHIAPSSIHHPQSFADIWKLCQTPDIPNFSEADLRDGKLDIKLYSPMPATQTSYLIAEVVPAYDTIKFLSGKRKEMVIREDHLIAYAESLIALSKQLQMKKYSAFVVPLRGGLRPWIQLNVLARNLTRTVFLPFTQASSGVHKDEIYAYLGKMLLFIDGDNPVRLAVIDTAEGGAGSLTLATIFSDLHRFHVKAKWEIDLFLLFWLRHGSHQQPRRTFGIEKLSTDRLKFNLRLWRVPQMIGEDWDEALGLKVGWDGDRPQAIRQSTEGDMIYIPRSGKAIAVSTKELNILLDALLSRVVNEAITTDPALPHFEDIWRDFLPAMDSPPRIILPGDVS